MQKLIAHAKCIPAGPDDEVVEAKHKVEAAQKADLLKALADLGIKGDGRLGPAKLEELLATARAAMPAQQPVAAEAGAPAQA